MSNGVAVDEDAGRAWRSGNWLQLVVSVVVWIVISVAVSVAGWVQLRLAASIAAYGLLVFEFR